MIITEITVTHRPKADVLRACKKLLSEQGLDLRTIELKIDNEQMFPDGKCITVVKIIETALSQKKT